MQSTFHNSYEAWVMALEPMTQFVKTTILDEKAKLEKQISELETRIAEHGLTAQRGSVLEQKKNRLREVLLHIKYR